MASTCSDGVGTPHSKYNLYGFDSFKLQVVQWSWDRSGACVVDGFRYGVGCGGALDCKVLNA